MGAFKFRGAFNALSQFTPAQRQRGVIAFSSGNHAQATALSARLLGMPSVIVMPQDAPTAKVAATRGYQQGMAGSEVVLYDRYTEDREAIGRRLQRARVELEAADEFDAVLVNGDLEQALVELERLMGLA